MRTPRLPPLGALRAFHAVARQRSFKLAAGALGVSATAVSHQIKLLESVLECRVCERSAQGVSLTADGEILYAATQRAFSALEQAVVQIAQARQPPSLTVTTTSNFLTHWLVPRLADFTARFPAIDLRLHTSVERVDLHLGTVDAAIRYRETPEPDLCCTLLHKDRFIVVASPTLALSRPDDLAQVTLFHVANRHVPADSPSWENWRRRYGPPTLSIDAGLTFSDETHALQAAVAGQGAVIASELLARDLLQRGVLSAPFRGALPGASYYLVTTEAAAQRADIIALREWLVGQMALGDSGQPAAG
ncbi:TPA: LysR family transcriptional regulator [Klebsiella quasipneumoniae subsp. quasipneumoniae]|uniref:LysR substrate-binding domain-containing protein n=1 Tax=Klebsiella quasipneumoniae TaxID=1463165 RepID=UPI0003BE5053|nr:LysR substrate-binding domain-containing protein [Klebsiella quasipneumoniae]ESL74391.1 LysR family transcriptional regulator, glycine cleavage system transcriptional activator [Klebsiella quasipneumoniae subsp. quasipneumoniae]HCI5938390.1 LysR family transcriptional regulator [Klebsiella quasipneumoniae subsp. quasipneumoniae]